MDTIELETHRLPNQSRLGTNKIYCFLDIMSTESQHGYVIEPLARLIRMSNIDE